VDALRRHAGALGWVLLRTEQLPNGVRLHYRRDHLAAVLGVIINSRRSYIAVSKTPMWGERMVGAVAGGSVGLAVGVALRSWKRDARSGK
jgi:hypothetical protein